MKLSDHFTLEEFVQSATAKDRGIDNTPEVHHIENMRLLCRYVLEPLRARFGTPIHINSGYRCSALNAAVHGARKSFHLQGRAADIPFKPGWLAYIRDHLPYTELINEGSWIHVAL